MATGRNDIFRFGEFELDRAHRQLKRDGEQVPLSAKAFDLLAELVTNNGEVVSKDELLSRVWPDQIVEENNLTVQMSALRKLLGDGNGSRYIATVPGRGYSFVAPIERSDDDVIIENRTVERIVIENSGSDDLALPPADQPRRVSSFVISAAAIAILAVVSAIVVYRWNAESMSNIESIAVMPFTDDRGSEDTAYLADGMTESLINSLSRLPKLTVKARHSVFSYKGKEIVPANVAKELSVQALLLGRITTRGEDVMLSLELLDARTGNHIWGETYQRKTTELSSLQSDIARDVADKLRTKLVGNSTLVKGGTNNVEAFQLYQKGRFFWNKRTQKDHEKAIELFNQALALDPNYALAWTGLGDVYTVDSFETGTQAERNAKAREYVTKALSFEPDLADAYTILAKIEQSDRHPAEANQYYLKAIELNPNYADARHWYGEFLSFHGRREAARQELDRAMELDPLSLVMMSDSAWAYIYAHDYDAAIEQSNKALELDPNWRFAITTRQIANEYKGNVAAALDDFEKQLRLSPTLSPQEIEQDLKDLEAQRNAFLKGGAEAYWRTLLQVERRRPEKDIDHLFVSIIYSFLGDDKNALDWLEKAAENNNRAMITIKADPVWERFANEPRYQALLDKLNLNAEF